MHIMHTNALKKSIYIRTSSYVVWRVDPWAMGQYHITNIKSSIMFFSYFTYKCNFTNLIL